MISYITGKIINKPEQSVVILTASGLGYEVRVAPAFFVELAEGEDVSLYTYLAVRENSLDLFGFKNLVERSLFTKFLGVSGIGPKSALHLLSLGTVEEISSAISRGDSTYLSKVSGVGKKTAERIVVELKSKVGELSSPDEDKNGNSLGEVIDALISLGYSKEEARLVVKSLDGKDKTSEQLVREALKSVSK